MIRAIIIDDERIAREGLLEFMKQFDFIECVGDFSNALQALELINNKQVDLVFLDINMPHINGIHFAERINNSSTMIVFTTAHPEYALKGYKLNTIDYLLKPIFFQEFEKAVFKAKNIYDLIYPQTVASNFLFFRENGVDKRIILNDIIYVKSIQNYVQIYLENEENILVHQTLKSTLKLLPDIKYVQIHRSYVVQVRSITSIDGYHAILHNKTLPIARERKARLMELLLNLPPSSQ